QDREHEPQLQQRTPMPTPSFLDRLIARLSPKAKYRRSQYETLDRILRSHAQRGSNVKRLFEGGGIGKRTEGWDAANTGPNTEIYFALHYLRNRSRDLVRNNPYASRAVQVISSNVIGDGIVAQPPKKHKTIGDLWREWGETTACDLEGRHNFRGLQA